MALMRKTLTVCAAALMSQLNGLSRANEPPHPPVRAPETADVFEQVFGKRRSKSVAATQMPVFLHGREMGLVKARVQGDKVEVERASFRARMATLLRRSALAKIDELGGQSAWLSAEQLQSIEVSLTYRPSDISLELDFPVEMRPVQVLRVGGRSKASEAAAGVPTLKSEPWSLIANAEWLTSQNLSDAASTLESTLALNMATRWHDWVLEQSGSYRSRGGTGTYKADQWRLVHDWMDEGWRMWVGDVSSPSGSTLSAFALGGLRLASYSALRPEDARRSPPSTTVSLARGGTVHVLVNGAVVDLLRLRPGVYDLRDVPVYHGANAIELVVTEADGKTSSHKMDYFFDSQLLPVGKREFDLALGFPVTREGLKVGYDTRSWVMSAWVREGWWPTLTGTWSVEAASMPNFKAQAVGTEAAWSSPLGVVAGWLRWNHHPQFNGYAAALQWQSVSDSPKPGEASVNASAQIRHTGPGYSSVVSNAPSLPTSDFGARVGIGPVAGWNAGFSVQKRWSGSALGDRSNWTLALRRRLAPGWDFDLSVGSTRQREGRQTWFTLGLHFSGMGSADPYANIKHVHAGSGYQSLSNQFDVNAGMSGVAQMLGSRSDWSMGYGQVSSGSNHGHSLAGTIANPRFRASASYRVNQRQGQLQQSLSTYLGSSVVVSPSGGLSWGAMVSDSAVQFKPRKGYGEGILLVDPVEDGRSAMSGDVFGTPHLANLRSHNERRIQFDVIDLPAGYPHANGLAQFKPSYRSVSVVEYGATAMAQLRGTVLGLDGKPHAMKALQLLHDNSQAETDVFTSRNGKFVSPHMPPGQYQLKDAETGQVLLEMEIGAEVVGLQDLGVIQMRITGANP